MHLKDDSQTGFNKTRERPHTETGQGIFKGILLTRFNVNLAWVQVIWEKGTSIEKIPGKSMGFSWLMINMEEPSPQWE